MLTMMEATTIMEGGWEDPPEIRGQGQDRGRDPPGAAAGRGPGVLPPWERRQQDRGPGCGQGWDQDCAVGGCGGKRSGRSRGRGGGGRRRDDGDGDNDNNKNIGDNGKDGDDGGGGRRGSGNCNGNVRNLESGMRRGGKGSILIPAALTHICPCRRPHLCPCRHY